METELTMDTKGGFLITMIKQVGGRVFEKILRDYGIDDFNGPQGRILYVLWKKDGSVISELSHETGLALTTLTSMLERMEKNHLIHRERSQNDKRKTKIYLTEESKGLQRKYEEVSKKMGEIYYKGFDEQETKEFEDYLQRVLNNVEEAL